MPLIRKERAGSDSFGNTWPEDGAAVDIDDAEQIAALMSIPDGGFSEVTPDADDEGPGEPSQEPADGENPDENTELSEVDPDAPAAEPKAEDDAKPAAKKPTARKTTARKPVEEG